MYLEMINGVNWKNKTFADLDQFGLKHLFSARAIAIEKMKNFNLDYVISNDYVPEYKGPYQNEKPFTLELGDGFEKIIDWTDNIEFKYFNELKSFLIKNKIEFNEDELWNEINNYSSLKLNLIGEFENIYEHPKVKIIDRSIEFELNNIIN